MHASFGKYSCKSFKNGILKYEPIIHIWKAVWGIPAPLKIKSFVWVLHCGRLPVIDHLVNFQMIYAQENICPLYGAHMKDITRLVLFCRFINPLWYNISSIWDMSLVCPQYMPSLFDLWFQSYLPTHPVQPWRLAFYTFIWSIWTMRNKVVFCHETFKTQSYLDLFKFHFV